MGIGPTRPAWKAGILPLNYTRISSYFTAVSTTLVYNSIIKKNCQIFFAVFLKKIPKNKIFSEMISFQQKMLIFNFIARRLRIFSFDCRNQKNVL